MVLERFSPVKSTGRRALRGVWGPWVFSRMGFERVSGSGLFHEVWMLFKILKVVLVRLWMS